MDDQQLGWVAAIFVGGIAGWLAEMITRSNMGLITNIILGMVGATVGSWLMTKLGFRLGGAAWVQYLISGLIGASLLILVTRLFYPDRWRT